MTAATESGLPADPSRLERLFRRLRSYWWLVLAVALVPAGVLAYLGKLPQLGDESTIAAAVALATLPGASMVFDYVISDRQQFRVLLVRVGLEDDAAGAWWLSKRGVRELDVDQSLYKPAPTLWFARDYDPADHEAVGTWRGTLSDAELLRGLNTVAELRGDLEDQARRGFLIESNLPSVVNRATRETARAIIKFFAGEELPDRGDGLESAVQDVLGELDANMTWDDLDDDLPEHMDVAHVDPTAAPDDADASDPSADAADPDVSQEVAGDD